MASTTSAPPRRLRRNCTMATPENAAYLASEVFQKNGQGMGA